MTGSIWTLLLISHSMLQAGTETISYDCKPGNGSGGFLKCTRNGMCTNSESAGSSQELIRVHSQEENSTCRDNCNSCHGNCNSCRGNCTCCASCAYTDLPWRLTTCSDICARSSFYTVIKNDKGVHITCPDGQPNSTPKCDAPNSAGDSPTGTVAAGSSHSTASTTSHDPGGLESSPPLTSIILAATLSIVILALLIMAVAILLLYWRYRLKAQREIRSHNVNSDQLQANSHSPAVDQDPLYSEIDDEHKFYPLKGPLPERYRRSPLEQPVYSPAQPRYTGISAESARDYEQPYRTGNPKVGTSPLQHTTESESAYATLEPHNAIQEPHNATLEPCSATLEPCTTTLEPRNAGREN